MNEDLPIPGDACVAKIGLSRLSSDGVCDENEVAADNSGTGEEHSLESDQKA